MSAALNGRRVLLATCALAIAALLAGPVAPASAQLLPGDDEPRIGPGVQMLTNGGQCTANFVFQGDDGQESQFPDQIGTARPVYLGYAAHCAGGGGATATNGCDEATQPADPGTAVTIENAAEQGRLAYTSWGTMQDIGETDASACQFNDFALVEVHPDDHHLLQDDSGQLDGSLPHWGGPQGIDRDGTQAGDTVYTYGNSELRLGIDQLKPKAGISLGAEGDGWNHPVYTLTPGIPGDSGSAVLSQDGEALGTLSTLALLPRTGSNGVSDLGRALDYANDEGQMGVTLVEGRKLDSGPLGTLLNGLGGLLG